MRDSSHCYLGWYRHDWVKFGLCIQYPYIYVTRFVFDKIIILIKRNWRYIAYIYTTIASAILVLFMVLRGPAFLNKYYVTSSKIRSLWRAILEALEWLLNSIFVICQKGPFSQILSHICIYIYAPVYYWRPIPIFNSNVLAFGLWCVGVVRGGTR